MESALKAVREHHGSSSCTGVVRKAAPLFPRSTTRNRAKPRWRPNRRYRFFRGSRRDSQGRAPRPEVVSAEPVPKSKKLLKLTVSLGSEQRTLVRDREHYAPADLVGKKWSSSRIWSGEADGVESNGMSRGSADGTLAVLTVDRDLPPSKVR